MADLVTQLGDAVDRARNAQDAVDKLGAGPVSRRHPAQVTSARLFEHLHDFADYLTPRDKAAIERVILALEQIANGER